MQEFEENIVTLQELLKRNDRHFVTCAYRALLGREPDLEGFTYYIERLRAGFSKMEVIKQLRTSNEGLAQITIFPELDRKIAQHKRGQIPVLGCIFRLLESTDSNKKRDRLFRAVQNQWHISNEEAKSSHIRMEDQNTDVKQILT